MSRHLAVIATTALLAATALTIASTPAAAAAIRSTRGPSDVSPLTAAPIERIVEIEGQQVRITLTVQNYAVRTATVGALRQPTLIIVALDTVDGLPLPEGLTATRVRLQRVASPHRVVRRDLTPRAFIATLIGHNEFGADVAPRLVANTRFRAAIRLEINGQIRNVPMGVLRVIDASTVL